MVFIDRDGIWFRFILNYLRAGSENSFLLPLNRSELKQLFEARFFGLSKLTTLIETKISLSGRKSFCKFSFHTQLQHHSDSVWHVFNSVLSLLSQCDFSVVGTTPNNHGELGIGTLIESSQDIIDEQNQKIKLKLLQ